MEYPKLGAAKRGSQILERPGLIGGLVGWVGWLTRFVLGWFHCLSTNTYVVIFEKRLLATNAANDVKIQAMGWQLRRPT